MPGRSRLPNPPAATLCCLRTPIFRGRLALSLTMKRNWKVPTFICTGPPRSDFPFCVSASTVNLGFTNTVNQVIGDTTYKLTLAPGGYMFDGKVLPFTTEERVIRVKQPDGSLEDEKITIEKTCKVRFSSSPMARPSLFASLASTVQECCRSIGTWARLITSREFQAALKRLQVPTFNIVYGDRQGHIMYIYNGIDPGTREWRFQILAWRCAGRHLFYALDQNSSLRRSAQGDRSSQRIRTEHQRPALDRHLAIAP